MDEWLRPTWYLDCDSPAVADFATRATAGATGDVERAVRLYYAVRDGIRYDPWGATLERERYRASAIAAMPAAYCVQKAILCAASARALGIPARLAYADVRNHIASEKLLERMGTDLFVFHGLTELFLEGRWVKATPVFNVELCRRFGVLPLEFDGRSDATLHPFDAAGRRHMEYVNDRGSYADFPYEELVRVFRETYPRMFEGEAPPAVDDDTFAATPESDADG